MLEVVMKRIFCFSSSKEIDVKNFCSVGLHLIEKQTSSSLSAGCRWMAVLIYLQVPGVFFCVFSVECLTPWLRFRLLTSFVVALITQSVQKTKITLLQSFLGYYLVCFLYLMYNQGIITTKEIGHFWMII